MSQEMSPPEAVEHLFQLYADDVYRYARFALNDSKEAEDVVQEVFIRVLRNWSQFRNESNPKTWVWRIMQNHLTDVLRKRKRQSHFLVYDVPDKEALCDTDTYLEIEEVISELPVTYRQVIVLRVLQDLSTHDAARILNWSETKVRTTLHRALQALRRSLSEPAGHSQRGEVHGLQRLARRVK